MYSVSAEYLTAISQAVQRGYISGYIEDVPFTSSDVLFGSASVSNKCVDSNDIKLGGVNIGTLKITFINTSLVPRGDWENKEILVSWNQLIDEESETFEQVPVGVFIVKEANHAAEGVVVTAYDYMSKLDKNTNFTTLSGTIYSILSMIAAECDFSLGMTRAEIEALPNGEETFSLYPENDIKTFRNLLSWVAQTAACFATFDRRGELVLREFKTASDMTISSDKRFKGGSFSDFKSYFTALSVVDIATQTTHVERVFPDTGLIMNLGSNPLLQYGLPETLQRERRAILTSLQKFNYVPFKTSLLGNPIFDLGDIFTFTDGLAGTSSKCCLMSYTYIFNRSYQMTGYGKNPALLGAQSKTDKNLVGVMSKVKENEVTFISYTNSDEILISYDDLDGLQETRLATLYASPIKDTTLEVNTRVIYQDLFTAGVNEEYVKTIKYIRYELDNEVIGRVPFEDVPFSIVDGRLLGLDRDNTIEDYQAILNVKAGERKTLDIYLEYEVNGTAANQAANLTIPPNGVNIILKGQGLPLDEAWDGFIRVADELNFISISGIGAEDLEEALNVSLVSVLGTSASDETPEAEIEAINIVNLDEAINITFVRPTFNIVDESGEYNLVTEDEHNIITE